METKEFMKMLQSAGSVLPLGNNKFRVTWGNGNQTYIEVYEAAQQSVQRTAIKRCDFCGVDTFNDEFGRCSVCGNRRR